MRAKNYASLTYLQHILPVLAPRPDDDKHVNDQDKGKGRHDGGLAQGRELQEHRTEVDRVGRHVEGVGKRHLLHGFTFAFQVAQFAEVLALSKKQLIHVDVNSHLQVLKADVDLILNSTIKRIR